MRLLLFFVLLALFTPCTTNNTIAVRNAVSSLWKAVMLLKKEYKEFNLDGMLGFKILLEQIKGTLERFDAKKDPHAFLLIKKLTKVLNEILKKSIYFTKQQDPEYFEEYQEFFEDQFWILPTSWNHTISSLVFSGSVPDSLCLTEQFSDECLSSVLGNLNEPCVVTAPCWKKMTQKGCTGFPLSHQLLFFLVGNMKRCRNDLFVKDGSYYTNIFCANMMKTNQEIENSGYPLHQQDLFMENIMLCGLSGYSDFYKLKWMNKIISWQDGVIGCFGDTGVGLNSENTANEKQSPKRVKRRERMFLDVCGSHKTATAVGALGGFLYSFTFM